MITWGELQVSESARRLPRNVDGLEAVAKVFPGIRNNTYFLVVDGNKPYANMTVILVPRVYATQPDYWGVEVVGVVSGIVIPAIKPYDLLPLPLDEIRGARGIEVIWSGDETQRIDVG